MPRISQLPSLTIADNSDEIAIVDVSSSTTKKITRGDLLKAPLPDNSVTTAAVANGAITADKVDFATFPKLASVTGTNSFTTENRIVAEITNYTFKAGVNYLITAVVGTSIVNGGGAVWNYAIRVGTKDIANNRRAAPTGTISPQSGVGFTAVVSYTTDTTIASTNLYVERLTGDNSLTVEIPRLAIIPMAFA